MIDIIDIKNKITEKCDALCSLFGECGGCLFQDISYAKELEIKRDFLIGLLKEKIDFSDECVQSVQSSPNEYHYRARLDLKLVKTKRGEIFIGFTPQTGKGILPIEGCPIAMSAISDAIVEIKKEAIAGLPEKYRRANLTVRTGEANIVQWGGIGKRSMRLTEDQYFYCTVEGRKVFYSLDTFFQANLSILPKLFQVIKSLDCWTDNTLFFDLYGGVGLFAFGMIDHVRKVILVEDCKPSVKLARFNVDYHQLDNLDIFEGQVEEHFYRLIAENADCEAVAMIDPPRSGLSESALQLMVNAKGLRTILYLSCNPEALARDLKGFMENDWEIQTIIPFDFFPKTKHLETLVVLKNKA